MAGRKPKIINDLIEFSRTFLEDVYWSEEHNQYQVPISHITGITNWLKLDEWSLFKSPFMAPVLAQMAYGKILEAGYDVTIIDFMCGEYRFRGSIGTDIFCGEPNENQWIAMWSGIKRAVEILEMIKQEKAS